MYLKIYKFIKVEFFVESIPPQAKVEQEAKRRRSVTHSTEKNVNLMMNLLFLFFLRQGLTM